MNHTWVIECKFADTEWLPFVLRLTRKTAREYVKELKEINIAFTHPHKYRIRKYVPEEKEVFRIKI